MRKITKCAVSCMAAIMAASMMMGTAAMAQNDSEVIAIPFLEEGAFDEVVMTNDDTVKTGINIRKTANENSEVIGYLYRGGAAWIVNKGEKWTEVYSGGITGFIKNDCLVFGNDVRGLAEHYGVEGVKNNWDDVKLFAKANAGSKVMELLDTNDSFILVEDQGHWLQVQYGADSVAYVSEDDVEHVLLFNTAVDKDGVYEALDADSYDVAYMDDSYTDDSYTYTEDTYSEPSYSEPTYTEPSYTDTYVPETSAPETSAPETSAPETSAPETEAPSVDDSYVDDDYTDDSYEDDTYYEEDDWTDDSIDTGDGGWYDVDTDTYYDADGNVITATYDTDTEETYAEETYVEETYAEETYAEETYVEETEAYVEETEAYVEETEAYVEETEAASASSDDTSLLAALIYCEAGNQSYEGMVAVGAVVMNRVYSASFPNTIREVIYQSGQFSPASSGWLDSALASGVPSTCYDAAVSALNGENPVPGALYFNTGSGKGMKIGDHQFY